MDAEQWEVAPYTEADLDRQATQLPDFLGDGRQADPARRRQLHRRHQRLHRRDQARPVQAAGRVRGARAPRRPAAVEGGRPDRDRLAGRRHLRQGRRRGARLVAGRRRAAEALRQAQGPARVPRLPLGRGPGVADHGARQALPLPGARRSSRARVARPDRGLAEAARRSWPPRPAAREREPARPGSASRAPRCRSRSPTRVLVSGRNSASGHPLMVAGPAGRLLQPADPDGAGRPRARPPTPARRSTRAAPSFIGVNLYVQLGRGRDYAWSATSAGQDIIDTYAMSLCEPGGGKATLESMHYRYRGSCLPIEVLEQDELVAALARRPTRRPARRRCGRSARSSGSSPAAAPSAASR